MYFIVLSRNTCNMHASLQSNCPRIKLAYLVQEDALPPYGNFFLLHWCLLLMIMNLFIDAAAALLLVTIVLDMISTSCY